MSREGGLLLHLMIMTPAERFKTLAAVLYYHRILYQRSPQTVLDSVLPGPLPCRLLVPGAIRLVHVGNLGDERIVGVGVGQHRADGEED